MTTGKYFKFSKVDKKNLDEVMQKQNCKTQTEAVRRSLFLVARGDEK